MRVFDCHVHVQPWEQMKPEVRALMAAGRKDLAGIQEALSDPGALLSLMDREGVEKAALINYVAPEVMGFTPAANDWVARYVRGHEDRLYAVGSVHPRHTRDAARRHPPPLRDARHPHPQDPSATPGLRGQRLPRRASPAWRRSTRVAEELGRPVTIHTGTSIFPGARNRFADPMAVDDVAVDFPKLKIVLAHAGRPLYMETAVFLVRRHPNVHLDLSGIPPKKLLEYLPRLEELSGRCLWGTDYPSPGVVSMRQNLEDFLALPLSEAAKERILWGNAAAVIG